MKVLIVLVSVLAFHCGVLCQQSAINKGSLRYPNELKGFELMKTSKLGNLVPGVTTAEELKAAYKLLGVGDDCKIQPTGGCRLDENWDVAFTQFDSREGNLAGIMFYPRKRIPFSKVRFPRQFLKGEMGIVHLTQINAEKFISYSDKYGLEYVIVDEATDEHYKKGDLFFIEYGVPEAESN